ncbi:MAG TPA: OmpA family protein, partial [Gammaproteobacteria bacterium]|nr:OmpA family protein [Gammaproteobacteria bacterium]
AIAGEIPQAIDIPLDPAASSLFLDKRTGLDVAAIGDFVPYTVTVRNATAGAPMTNVVVMDSLPPGMRYQAGSARLDSTVPLEPEISADGSTLTFHLPDLAAQRSATVRYVAVVVTGAVGATLVNRAIARADDGSASNTASAAVLLREELFTTSSLLLGRIRVGTCGASGDGTDGVEGVRVYLEDGRYAVTDDEGKYHFEGLTPGSHVVQLDPITLPADVEPLHCDTRVRSAGNALSQFVDMRGGALGTADFVVGHRAPPTGDVRFSLTTQLADDHFEHTATISAHDVPLAESEVVVLLPDTFTYLPGSAARDGTRLPDPAEANGSLRFTLGPVAADLPKRLMFATRAAAGSAGDHSVQALLRFTTELGSVERTEPVANLVHSMDVVERASYTFSPRSSGSSFAPKFGSGQTRVDSQDVAELDRIAAEWRDLRELTIHVIGHSDRTPIAARNRARFPDNYALSRARAQAVADYLQGALPDARIDVEGRGADQPISEGTDAASLARNRRVEIEVEGVRAVSAADWSVVKPDADSPTVTTTGMFASDDEPARPLASAHPPNLEALEPEIDISTVEPALAILQPSEGFAPPVPNVHVTIAHLPGQKVQLTVNGRPVSELTFDGTKLNEAKTAALSHWRGVDLVEGENRIVATVLDAEGSEVTVLGRSVRYGGGAVRAELVAEQSHLMADGRTQPLIALRVFDASGQPARPGTLGAYRVDPPYRTWWEVETLHDNPLLVESNREPTFAVEEDGLVRILLEPTTESGTALIRLRFNERQEQEIRAWLEPEQRDWILVGIAETTTAYTSLEAAMEPPDVEDGYSGDGRLAFFAKGRIKGSSLLTIAFDSDRDRRQVEDRLFGTIEPDRYYTLYGDAVEQRFEAATTRKLYLKIERRQFAALFGDFETGLTVTELSRYSRSLTGLKADFGGERFAVNAFAAENRERYGRDEFVGDGTSGPYRLSRTPLVANSDRLRIEVRDRVRTEVVIESRQLTRFIDYSLDYYTGTLTFKQPIPSRDSAFNPVYIIA